MSPIGTAVIRPIRRCSISSPVSRAPDLLIVQITPAQSTETPTSAQEITRRLDQITFNSSLQAELASLARRTERSRQLSGLFSSEGRKLRRLAIHHISAEEEFSGLSDASAKNLDLEPSSRRCANMVAPPRIPGSRARRSLARSRAPSRHSRPP